jgi:HEPN domain-containing protein/predicted nucleotidyltransferase
MNPLSHLPLSKQSQIMEITAIIKEVVQPEMIILFGSYAKGKQVEHRYTGKDGIRYEYISDYDFLVVTKDNTIKEYVLEDIINNRTQRIEPSVNLQIHEIDYINEGLEFGQYFFTDIVKEGIKLYDKGNVEFAQPRQLTVAEEKEIAQQYFDMWFKRGNSFLKVARLALENDELNTSVFNLHQAAESFYNTTLLVFTGYKPKTHNLWKLRKQSKTLSEEFFLIFPVETNEYESHLFDLLKQGYIEARYKSDYIITEDELSTLIKKVEIMREVVKKISLIRIEEMTIS